MSPGDGMALATRELLPERDTLLGKVRATSCRAHGPGLVAATVREPARFTIELVVNDEVEQQQQRTGIQRPADEIFVGVRGVSRVHPRITAEGKGKYTVEWRPLLSGQYQIAISHLGVALPGSPFSVIATTPEPFPTQCSLNGDALTMAVAHKTQSFAVSFKDKLGATTHASELDVFVEPVFAGSPRGRPTRNRKIRVKVGGRPIAVRSSPELDSEQIGELLPGAVITVVEERFTRGGDVQACVALDYIAKVDRQGKAKEKAISFRSSTGDRSSSRREVTSRAPSTPSVGAPIEEPSQQHTPPTGSTASPDTIAETQARPSRANVRGGHNKVQKKFGMKLSTEVATREQQQQQLGGSRPSHRQGSSQRSNRNASSRSAKRSAPSARKLDWSEQQAERSVGWATIVSQGTKLVSSRMRLNVEMRREYQQQWARRVANVKTAETMRRARDEGGVPPEAKAATSKELIDKALLRSLNFEVESAKAASNAAAFAFGGVYPGTLHAHGKLPEAHRVFYSIGVAGAYLLHVRLRKQAAALPGSPFMLQVNPGEAYARSTHLPAEVRGEVGGLCSHVISTADQVGNLCIEGGAKVTLPCSERDELQATSKDHGNGTYTIQWNGKRTGTFKVGILIAGVHVVGSPTWLKLSSSRPDLSRCAAYGNGLTRCVKGEKGVFHIRFQDVFGNATSQEESFRSKFRAGIALTNPGVRTPTMKTEYDFVGTWWVDEEGDGTHKYQVTFVPTNSGAFALHVWVESVDAGAQSERIYVVGSPFDLSVHANASDQVASVTTHEVIDASGIMPGDYKISREVFDEAQRRWGECSIDAFASVATTTLARFWTEKPKTGAEGTDAFKQNWQHNERIWAHPPLQLLDALAQHLQRPDRCAEVIVCAPYRPKSDWFQKISLLSDERKKYMAGKLSKVADDAPSRVNEWPIVVFRIPAQTPKHVYIPRGGGGGGTGTVVSGT